MTAPCIKTTPTAAHAPTKILSLNRIGNDSTNAEARTAGAAQITAIAGGTCGIEALHQISAAIGRPTRMNADVPAHDLFRFQGSFVAPARSPTSVADPSPKAMTAATDRANSGCAGNNRNSGITV